MYFSANAKSLLEIAQYKSLQAVIECGSDAKIVERRGEVYRTLQNLGA
jgi:hypothetical protein